MHSLTRKSEPLCMHAYLILKAGLESEKSEVTKVQIHEVDRKATVSEVIKLVQQHFPTATEDNSEFLKKNKNFVDNLCKVKDINTELLKYSIKQCPFCDKSLENWHHKTKESYLISLAEVKQINVQPGYCKNCELIVYYNLYSFGCIPIHNKVIVITSTKPKLNVSNISEVSDPITSKINLGFWDHI